MQSYKEWFKKYVILFTGISSFNRSKAGNGTIQIPFVVSVLIRKANRLNILVQRKAYALHFNQGYVVLHHSFAFSEIIVNEVFFDVFRLLGTLVLVGVVFPGHDHIRPLGVSQETMGSCQDPLTG